MSKSSRPARGGRTERATLRRPRAVVRVPARPRQRTPMRSAAHRVPPDRHRPGWPRHRSTHGPGLDTYQPDMEPAVAAPVMHHDRSALAPPQHAHRRLGRRGRQRARGRQRQPQRRAGDRVVVGDHTIGIAMDQQQRRRHPAMQLQPQGLQLRGRVPVQRAAHHAACLRGIAGQMRGRSGVRTHRDEAVGIAQRQHQRHRAAGG